MSLRQQLFLQALREAEHAPPRRIRDAQTLFMRRIARHAFDQAPAWRKRLAPLFARGDEPDLSRWNEIPVLGKHEIIADPAAFVAAAVPPESGPRARQATSGSMRVPFAFETSQSALEASRVLTERSYEWAECEPWLTMAEIRPDARGIAPPPYGRTGKGWSISDPEGPYVNLSVLAPLADQLAFLERHRPAYLTCSPMSAAELARASAGSAWREHLRTIFTIGNVVTEDHREAVLEGLGIGIVDNYGAVECGLIATQCPGRSHYHLFPETVLVEIVDDEGQPVPAGETGRLVVTSFLNFAMPFIRYDLGDVGRISDRVCDCGRRLPVLAEIGGRIRNSFILPDGRRQRPPVRAAALQEVLPNRLWQYVQTGRAEAEMRYVPIAEDQPEPGEAAVAYLRRITGEDFAVRFRRMDAIPRSAGGKFEETLSLIEA